MPSRSAGAIMSSAIWRSASPSSGERMLRATARWISRSVGIGPRLVRLRQNGGSLVGLLDQHFERGNVAIPFDHGRPRAEAQDSLPEQRPYRGLDRRSVIVDPQLRAVAQLLDCVTGEVQLLDLRRRQCLKVGYRIPAVIGGADENVVHVAEDAAAGPSGDGDHELALRNCRVAVADAPGQRFGDEARLDARRKADDAVEMIGIEAVDAAKR